MIVTVNTRQEVQKGDYTNLEVSFTKEDGSDGKKEIFGSLKDKWPLIVVGQRVEIVNKKNEKGFWNVVDIKPPPEFQEAAESAGKPPSPVSRASGEERDMWFKEIGMMIRSGHLKRDTTMGEACYQLYFGQMQASLGLIVTKKEE